MSFREDEFIDLLPMLSPPPGVAIPSVTLTVSLRGLYDFDDTIEVLPPSGAAIGALMLQSDGVAVRRGAGSASLVRVPRTRTRAGGVPGDMREGPESAALRGDSQVSLNMEGLPARWLFRLSNELPPSVSWGRKGYSKYRMTMSGVSPGYTPDPCFTCVGSYLELGMDVYYGAPQRAVVGSIVAWSNQGRNRRPRARQARPGVRATHFSRVSAREMRSPTGLDPQRHTILLDLDLTTAVGGVLVAIASADRVGRRAHEEAITMARLFNLKVLEANVPGGATARNIYTEADVAATLGSADSFDVQINVDAISTANTTLTFTYDNSNDGQNWQTGVWTDTLNIATLADAPTTTFYHVAPTSAFPFLALGRFGVKADQPGAFVRIIVCGRSQ